MSFMRLCLCAWVVGLLPQVAVAVPGETGAPVAQVTPDPIEFGEVPIGIPRFQLVEVANGGGAGSLLEVSDTVLSGPGLSFEPAPELPFTVAADGSSSVSLSIRLDPQPGAQSGELTLVSNDPSSPLVVPITYSGNVPPVCDAGGPYVVAAAVPLVLDGSGSVDPDGTIVDYTWQFGDGALGHGPTPTHTYTLQGTFDVTLCVRGDFDRVSCCTTTVTVEPNGALTPVMQVVPDVIDFGQVAGGSILFGSVGVSNKGDAGSVLVVTDLIASGPGTSIESAPDLPFFLFAGGLAEQVVIRHVVGTGPNAANLRIVSNAANSPFDVPIASIGNDPPDCDTGGPYGGVAGVPVTFVSESTDQTGAIVSWNWTFGDGGVASGETVEHTYLTDGGFVVGLCVVDEFGAERCCSTVATISGLDCDAGGPYSGIQGGVVAFDGSGSSSPNGAITGYEWDFGDGSTATGATPTHVYSDAGTYPVQLTATDVVGASSSCTTLAVIDGIACDPGASQTAGIGEPLTFDGSGSTTPNGPIVSYDWDFGDGSSASGAIVEHTYTVNGVYFVTLCVVDAGGFDACCTTVAEIVPEDPPICDAGGPYEATIGTAIVLDGSGSNDPGGTIVSYAWEFGDGATGTGATPTHVYTEIGTYPVTLCVTDDDDNVICCSTTVLIPYAGTEFATLPLHAVQVEDAPCWISDPCPHPTVQVEPGVASVVYLLAQTDFAGMSGLQTAFDFSSWTLVSQEWDCQTNQITVRAPTAAGGPTEGTLTTSFDCVMNGGTAVIGRMFVVPGAFGSCLMQVDSSFPFGTHLAGCSGSIESVEVRGFVCAGVAGYDACGITTTGVEPTTWGSIKSQFLRARPAPPSDE